MTPSRAQRRSIRVTASIKETWLFDMIASCFERRKVDNVRNRPNSVWKYVYYPLYVVVVMCFQRVSFEKPAKPCYLIVGYGSGQRETEFFFASFFLFLINLSLLFCRLPKTTPQNREFVYCDSTSVTNLMCLSEA